MLSIEKEFLGFITTTYIMQIMLLKDYHLTHRFYYYNSPLYVFFFATLGFFKMTR